LPNALAQTISASRVTVKCKHPRTIRDPFIGCLRNYLLAWHCSRSNLQNGLLGDPFVVATNCQDPERQSSDLASGRKRR
jgi:hypothetical protein